MKAMSFYTANGWAGSNYDSKLSTKEIAAKVRAYAKKNFPEFKFSVRSEWSMCAGSMAVELKAGPCVPFIEGSRSAERGYMSTMSSVESSLKNDLPGIIEFNDKIESDTLSISSYYTPMAEGMEFYEKKVKGKRYITENRTKRGYYVIDTLDNCPVGFFQTKEEAEREAETLNGFTDGNGRLKTVI